MKLEATGPVALANIEEAVAHENAVAVPGVAGKRIRGLAAVISSNAGATIHFHGGTGPASGNLIIPANNTLTIPPMGTGWGETDVGQALLFNCTGPVSGFVRYQTIN